MKLILLTFSLVLFSLVVKAQNTHANHNMVILGTNEVFLSHIVYKVPHNYQVIIKLGSNGHFMTLYSKLRTGHAPGKILFLIKNLDISQIQSAKVFYGDIILVNENGERFTYATDLEIADFDVVYFDELPLNLDHAH